MKKMSFKCPPSSTPINCPTIEENILHRSCRKNDSGCPTKKIEIPIGEQIWQRYTDSSGKCFFYKNNALKGTDPIWEPLSEEKGSVFVTNQIIQKNEIIEKCKSLPEVLEAPQANIVPAPVYTAPTPEPYDPYPPPVEPNTPVLERHTRWYKRNDNEGTWYENMDTHETVLELPEFGEVIKPPTDGTWETKRNGNSPYCLHESGYTLLGPCANEKTPGNTPVNTLGTTPGNTRNEEAEKLGLTNNEYRIYLKYINKNTLTYTEKTVALPYILGKVSRKELSNTYNSRIQNLLKKYQNGAPSKGVPSKGVPSIGGRRTRQKKLKQKKGKSRKYHRK